MRHDPGQRSSNHGETVEQEQKNGFGYDRQLYVRAIAGLRSRIGILSQKGPDEGLKDSIEVLAFIVQLILLEVSLGNTLWLMYSRVNRDVIQVSTDNMEDWRPGCTRSPHLSAPLLQPAPSPLKAWHILPRAF